MVAEQPDVTLPADRRLRHRWYLVGIGKSVSAVQQQPSDEIFRRGRDQFDRLYLDGQKAPRVMAIAIHPYLTGVPHRIKYLEALYDYIMRHEGVVMWTGAEILDWYVAARGKQAGGSPNGIA